MSSSVKIALGWLVHIKQRVEALNADFARRDKLKNELEELKRVPNHSALRKWEQEHGEEWEDLLRKVYLFDTREDIVEMIRDEAAEVLIRSGWMRPDSPTISYWYGEYRIYLHKDDEGVIYIRGSLACVDRLSPRTAELMFTPNSIWAESEMRSLHMTEEEEEALLEYASVFYFGRSQNTAGE